MFVTILIGLLLLAALALAVFGRFTTQVNVGDRYRPEMEDRTISFRWAAAIPLVIAIGIGFFATTATVDAKNVGVVTQFKRPVGTEDAGWVWKAPWQGVTEIDGTVQTDEYKGDGCIYVRIGDGSRSCVTTTLRWRIVPNKADVIFGDYRSDDPTESFRDAVISTQFKSANQAVLAGYNPVAELEVVDGSNAQAAAELSFAPDYDQIAADLEQQMTDRLGDDPLAEIVSISVSYVSLSDSTQKTIDDFIKAVGETRIAAQAKSTATEQAAANETIQGSLSNNAEGVLQSRCIDAVNTAIEKGYDLPAGFNCLGAGSAVVVPSAGAPAAKD